ncbi:pilus assembly PilX family protein [Glaciimonas immobilis]|uniref:Type IV pilus assembly protein PilX n=1 Tax=Glaciimonas immobilis TaxID=728004 RepID=A0A840RS18_9BURK|nr:PilX N-terminal domain-containing pilus assembly protein [Glaciimonas immobilis]KAF3996931.1 hypothetical protein HAV38_14680 [Glaciimonas immobilis]MBB5199756.1 type IV pilus assembly protein PilX [Glaciimonas immobilis]
MVLPLTLIFVLVMTMIGVTAIRNVTLEEKMAANFRSQKLAFEAAEQVLRYCEKLSRELALSNATLPPQLTPGPIEGGKHHGKNKWEIAANWRSDAISIALPSQIVHSIGLAEVPRCMIEKMTLANDYEFQLNPTDFHYAYRITARGIGTTSSVAVFLQSYLRL